MIWTYDVTGPGNTTAIRKTLQRYCQPSLAIMATIDDNVTDNLMALYQTNPDWADRIDARVAAYALAYLNRKNFDTNGITIKPQLVSETDHTIS